MMLEWLYALAKDEGLLAEPDYEPKAVAWVVRIGDKGDLLTIEGTHQEPENELRGKKRRPKPKVLSVPRQPIRTSGNRAFFLCDKAEYVVGIDPRPDSSRRRPRAKLAARFALFREQVDRCADVTQDAAVQAVSRFLRDVAEQRVVIELPDGCQPNDLFAFVYAPDVDRLVHDRPRVREYWTGIRAADAKVQVGRMRCLVTGQLLGDIPNFPQLRKVPGGKTSGVSLVSFNNPAFESHGWGGNENAPISREAAEAVGTALNRLLDPAPVYGGRRLARRSLVVSDDTVVCFWAPARRSEPFLDQLPFLLMGDDPSSVADLYRSIWRGSPVSLDDDSAFVALTLSGAQARAVVRDWLVTTVREVAVNLSLHFGDLRIAAIGGPGKDQERPVLPLRTMLTALAPPGRNEKPPPHLAAQVVRAALHGTGYPLAILQRALERTRAEIGRLNDSGVEGWRARERQDARAAMIKAVLRRRPPRMEIGEAMDPTDTNPGYLLGRLMATLERLQQVALGDVNASVVDRYFGAASATPRAVFTRLLKNARHHASKAKDEPRPAGTARWLEGVIDEIAAQFSPKQNGFPAHLDLQQQGLFVLGYHQQRHWLWLSKEERAKVEAVSKAP